jgi:hypothetical protein
MKLDELLSALGKDYFYIMHLSYGGSEKKRLWDYAVDKQVIGLDLPRDVTDNWSKIRQSAVKILKSGWINQFDMFCYEMGVGDIVVVLEGQEHVLGTASLVENRHRYCKKLT